MSRAVPVLLAAVGWSLCLGVALGTALDHLDAGLLASERLALVLVLVLGHGALAASARALVARVERLRWAEPVLPVVLLGLLWLPALPGQTLTPATPKAPTEGPSFLLLSIDGLGAHHTSPTLEALAAESVVYTSCVSPTPASLPAHASLLTGKVTRQHQVTGPSDHLEHKTLTRHLRREGYRTGAFPSSSDLGQIEGLQADFTHWEQSWGAQRWWSWMPTLAWLGQPSPRRQGAQTVERALAWAGERPTRAFAWVHLQADAQPLEPVLTRLLDGLEGAWVVMVAGTWADLDASRVEDRVHVPCMVRAPGLAPGGEDGLTGLHRLYDVGVALGGGGDLPRIAMPMVEVYLPDEQGDGGQVLRLKSL